MSNPNTVYEPKFVRSWCVMAPAEGDDYQFTFVSLLVPNFCGVITEKTVSHHPSQQGSSAFVAPCGIGGPDFNEETGHLKIRPVVCDLKREVKLRKFA